MKSHYFTRSNTNNNNLMFPALPALNNANNLGLVTPQGMNTHPFNAPAGGNLNIGHNNANHHPIFPALNNANNDGFMTPQGMHPQAYNAPARGHLGHNNANYIPIQISFTLADLMAETANPTPQLHQGGIVSTNTNSNSANDSDEVDTASLSSVNSLGLNTARIESDHCSYGSSSSSSSSSSSLSSEDDIVNYWFFEDEMSDQDDETNHDNSNANDHSHPDTEGLSPIRKKSRGESSSSNDSAEDHDEASVEITTPTGGFIHPTTPETFAPMDLADQNAPVDDDYDSVFGDILAEIDTFFGDLFDEEL